ncbi:MAG: FAD-dependent oxidoreductase [Candidatus Kapaibacteriota bacterium]|jgi:kynurenine 3-monooxygenase
MNKNSKFVISGAGLAGSLMAVMLAKQGFEVELFEKREDMRKVSMSAGRSINLALSIRGIRALESVGIATDVLKEAIPMFGRYIHLPKGNHNFQSYSGKAGKFINSVSRGGLNINLLDEADKLPNLKIYFSQSCDNVDFKNKVIIFKSTNGGESITTNYDYLVGADGFYSGVRRNLSDNLRRFDYSQTYLEHGYKELMIHPNEDGSFQLEKNALHIWPRGQFMMIGLPNSDGSFTCTLFMPFGGKNGFDDLDTKEKVENFFATTFKDAYDIMPTLVEDYFTNPTSPLGTIRCAPWNYEDSVVLIGDAAHAIVPFYGQGMNASFEDCRILNELIEDRLNGGKNYPIDGNLFEEFFKLRKPNGDGVANLALENYIEMRAGVIDPNFVKKRQLELKMEEKYSDFDSKYSLVTFRDDVEYQTAKHQGAKLDNYLLDICKVVEDIDAIDMDSVYENVKDNIYTDFNFQ